MSLRGQKVSDSMNDGAEQNESVKSNPSGLEEFRGAGSDTVVDAGRRGHFVHGHYPCSSTLREPSRLRDPLCGT
ncbi:hypothetical protein AGR1B_Cc120413 [Agrobacterium fabacearum S56]|nr:hypothetical protein AGR1C_Cc10410 [Agrobacterium fabacearum TT111]CUW89744.1 hypothetical protein AGR1B_Cc120413 [Agrobacterium fabacearum S56]